ncbi:MAG: DUF5658 family protein [Planctomycetota bacterium]
MAVLTSGPGVLSEPEIPSIGVPGRELGSDGFPPRGRLLGGFLSRPMRVVLLVVSTVILGLADLWITMTYLLSVGMFEDNPIARYVISLGSPALVIAFKLASIFVASGITLACRRRWQGEALAWVSLGIMLSLLVRWLSYIEFAGVSVGTMAVVSLDPSYADGSWVSLR